MLQDVILREKLAPPESDVPLIKRPHAIGVLERACAASNTVLVSGMACSGKTLAVKQLADSLASSAPCAWVRLDEFDTLRSLAIHLVAALEGLIPEPPETIGSKGHAAQIPQIVSSAVTIAAKAMDASLLVVDDYHLVESPASDAIMEQVAAALNPAARMIVVSRTPLDGLRACKALAEASLVTANDLAFSNEDTLAFLKSRSLETTRGEASAIQRLSGGSPSLIQILTGFCTSIPNAESPAASDVSQRALIRRFLEDELLVSYPADVAQVAQLLALLGKACPALLKAALDVEAPEAALRILVETGFAQQAEEGWAGCAPAWYLAAYETVQSWPTDHREQLREQVVAWCRLNASPLDVLWPFSPEFASLPAFGAVAGAGVPGHSARRSLMAALEDAAEVPRANAEGIRTDSPLSTREASVLRACAQLGAVGPAAASLGITQQTARTHLKNAYRHLGVHSRADAIARAIELGLI